MADSHMFQEVDQACRDCPIEQKHLQCHDKQLEEFEMPRKKKFEAFTVNLNAQNETSLQNAFLKFKKQKQIEIQNNKNMKKKNKKKRRLPKEMAALRHRFMEQAKKYYGVPYAKKYWAQDTPEYKSPLFLDCCGLVRRVMHDLEDAFGFRLGPWNQAYMYDTLPITLHREEEMKPGDLVFMSGIYTNPKAKQQRHLMTHVEIWAGEGTKTIGSRWNNGKVQMWDSYKFTAKSFHSERYHFKSIDTWLKGICKSYCSQHKWKLKKFKPVKKSIFNIKDDENQIEKQSTGVDELASEDIAADGQNITDSEDSDISDYEQDAEVESDPNNSDVPSDSPVLPCVEKITCSVDVSQMFEEMTCEKQSPSNISSNNKTNKTVSLKFPPLSNKRDAGASAVSQKLLQNINDPDEDLNDANCLKVQKSVNSVELSDSPVLPRSHSDTVLTYTHRNKKYFNNIPNNDENRNKSKVDEAYSVDSELEVNIDQLTAGEMKENKAVALVNSSSQTRFSKSSDILYKYLSPSRKTHTLRNKTFVAASKNGSLKLLVPNRLPPGNIKRSKTVCDMKKPVPTSKSAAVAPATFEPFRLGCLKPQSHRQQAGNKLMNSVCVEGKAFTRVKSKTVIPQVRSCGNFNRLTTTPADASSSSPTNSSAVFPVKCHSAPQLLQHKSDPTESGETAFHKNSDLCQHFHLLDLNCPDRFDQASSKKVSSSCNEQLTEPFPVEDEMKESRQLTDVTDCCTTPEPTDGETNNTEKGSQNFTGAK